MMRQTMWDIVRLRGRPGYYWRRYIAMPGMVMVIPVVNDIPIVHKFEIIGKELVINEEDHFNGRG